MRRLVLATLLAAPAALASVSAEAVPVTAKFDLTSPSNSIVALPGATAVFTANTGIKFSATGGIVISSGSGISDGSVEIGPDGTGVAGNNVVSTSEFFFFSDPTAPDGTPLPGQWTAFTVVGEALSLPSFNIDIVDDFTLISAGEFTISPYLTPLRFTIGLLGDNGWAFTRRGDDGFFSIQSLEYTYDSADVPGAIPLPAGALLLLGGLGVFGAASRVLRR